MAAPLPATEELNAKLARLVYETRSFLPAGAWSLKLLLAEADKLTRADAAAGSLAKAMVMSLTGSLGDALYWVKNARNFTSDFGPDGTEMVIKANLHHFSEAAVLFDRICEESDAIALLNLQFGPLLGCFRTTMEVADRANAKGIPVEAQDEADISREVVAALSRLQIAESDVRAMLDVAGEVMRERRLFTVGTSPMIDVHMDGDGASILIQYIVDVPIEDAVDMSWDVVERLVKAEASHAAIGVGFLPLNVPEEEISEGVVQ